MPPSAQTPRRPGPDGLLTRNQISYQSARTRSDVRPAKGNQRAWERLRAHQNHKACYCRILRQGTLSGKASACGPGTRRGPCRGPDSSQGRIDSGRPLRRRLWPSRATQGDPSARPPTAGGTRGRRQPLSPSENQAAVSYYLQDRPAREQRAAGKRRKKQRDLCGSYPLFPYASPESVLDGPGGRTYDPIGYPAKGAVHRDRTASFSGRHSRWFRMPFGSVRAVVRWPRTRSQVH